MKTLALLLLLGITSTTAYLYAYEPIIDLVGLSPTTRSTEAHPTTPDVSASLPVQAPPPLPAPPGTPTAEPAMKTTEPTPAMTPPPSPTMPPVAAAESTPKADADGFVPPTFAPIEDVVKNWTQIPVGAFPRQIRVMKPVEFVTAQPAGNKMSSKVPAGSHVQAISQEAGSLIIAMSTSSAARTQIEIDDTDFKAVLTDAYEQWKVATTERARKTHLAARQRAALASKDGASNTVGAPTRNADGTYDILLASMKAGQVVDITPQSIRKWGDPVREEVDGQTTWTISVDVTVKSLFGPIDTQAVAHIRDGKVVKWLYASGEEVP